ncbi:MAG: zinc-dependent alcohol dehydrogenase [Acidobacteriota bacterium]
MLAVQYVKSVPRYLTARFLGPSAGWIYTSPLGCIRLAEVAPPPLPAEDWCRIQPTLSGICGSDLATITARGSAYFSPFTSHPFVLGHEVVGTVLEVGQGVTNLHAGDRVVLEPPLHCEVRGIEKLCRQCRDGNTARCENITRGKIAAGIQTGFCRDTGGGWSSDFVAHYKQLHVLPENLSDREAVLIEPFSCSLKAALEAPLDSASRAIVLGCGTVGALLIAAIRGLGSSCRIIAVAKYPHQREIAHELGADVVLESADLYESVRRELGATSYQPELGRPVFTGGADICFDCVGSDRTIDDALRFTRGGGTIMLVGMPAVPKSVDWTAIWHKELTIKGSYTSGSPTFQRAIRMVAGMNGRLSRIVGAIFPLVRYKEAIKSALDTGRSGVMKTALRIDV